MIAQRLYAILIALLLVACASVQAETGEIELAINGHKLSAEVARTDAQRMTGLMHRRMLPENRGMLFIFPDISRHGMWMMNTYVPLSVAFVDERGVIVNIEDMEPLTQNAHNAAKPVKYALEMNRGWFKKRGIKAGAKIEGIERAGTAR